LTPWTGYTPYQFYETDEQRTIHYSQLIETALNSDILDLMQIFSSICFPDIQVDIFLYNSSKRKIRRENLRKHMTMVGLGQFYFFWQNLLEIIPDGVTLLKSPRKCETDGETAVYIAFFEFLGHSLIEGHKVFHSPATIPLTDQIQTFNSKTVGSITVYVNVNGYISCIEFYLRS
jgi:hypothetical protein